MASNLKDDPKLEAELICAVAYGLRNCTLFKPARRASLPDPRDSAARAVVEYLKLSNWVIARGPPNEMHGIPWRANALHKPVSPDAPPKPADET